MLLEGLAMSVHNSTRTGLSKKAKTAAVEVTALTGPVLLQPCTHVMPDEVRE